MGYASHRQQRRLQAREEADRMRAQARALPHVDARANAWRRTVGGILAQFGGRLTLEDVHAESVGPSDRLQVDRDEANKTTVFTLIRGGYDE